MEALEEEDVVFVFHVGHDCWHVGIDTQDVPDTYEFNGIGLSENPIAPDGQIKNWDNFLMFVRHIFSCIKYADKSPSSYRTGVALSLANCAEEVIHKFCSIMYDEVKVKSLCLLWQPKASCYGAGLTTAIVAHCASPKTPVSVATLIEGEVMHFPDYKIPAGISPEALVSGWSLFAFQRLLQYAQGDLSFTQVNNASKILVDVRKQLAKNIVLSGAGWSTISASGNAMEVGERIKSLLQQALKNSGQTDINEVRVKCPSDINVLPYIGIAISLGLSVAADLFIASSEWNSYGIKSVESFHILPEQHTISFGVYNLNRAANDPVRKVLSELEPLLRNNNNPDKEKNNNNECCCTVL